MSVIITNKWTSNYSGNDICITRLRHRFGMSEAQARLYANLFLGGRAIVKRYKLSRSRALEQPQTRRGGR